MKNSWSCWRASVPRTLIFRTVRMQDLILKYWWKWIFHRVQSPKTRYPCAGKRSSTTSEHPLPTKNNICDRIEGLCMLLRRFSYPCRYSDMISRFRRPVPELCMITNEVMDNIFNNHGHRISQWNDDVFNPHLLQEYADVIHAEGAPLENCFGFIDGTLRPIARPH